MGYLRPTAIIVGGSYGHHLKTAHGVARRIFDDADLGGLVSPIIDGASNSEQSFYVAWDGSKEGWETSDKGDAARDELVAYLRQQAYDDGSSPLDWIEVQFGGDDREAIALNHSGQREIVA